MNALDDERALVLHVGHHVVVHQHMSSRGAGQQHPLQSLLLQTGQADKLAGQRGDGQTLEVDGSEEADGIVGSLDGEVEAEPRPGRKSVVEPNPIGDAAYLYQVIARQTQNVRGREGFEGGLESLKAPSSKPVPGLVGSVAGR